MRKILEVSTDHIDETENTQSVDVYFVDDDGEEGTVAAEVCLDTGKVFYRDNLYRVDKIEEAIAEIRKTIVKKIPKVVITISGGNFQDYVSSEDVEVALIDFDVEYASDDDEIQPKDIPFSVEDGRVEKAYASEVETDIHSENVNPERVNQLFEIIRG